MKDPILIDTNDKNATYGNDTHTGLLSVTASGVCHTPPKPFQELAPVHS